MTRRRWASLLAVASSALLALTPGVAGGAADKPPNVTPAHVTDVGATTATVRAGVNTRGDAATYAVEWGTAGAFGARTPDAPLPAANGNQQVAATLEGLAPGTTYRVRVVASNPAGSDAGADVSFTTAPAAPPPATPAPSRRPTPGDDAPPQARPAPDLRGGPVATGSDAVLGEDVVVGTREGVVRVRVPGTDGYSPLGPGASVPVGSIVDATHGTVHLITARRGGATQDALLRGATFEVRQARSAGGMTDLVLRGGDFRACRRSGRTVARSAGRARRAAPRRSLWAKDRRGRFRTRGRNSVATVRGTEWTTTDTCAGTTTSVREGAVLVRERRTGRRVLVRAGERHLARALRR